MSFPTPWKKTLPDLHAICRHGNKESASSYINEHPEEICKPFKGHYPIHDAAEYNNIEVLELLIEAGADINICTNGARTPLIIAATKSHSGIIEVLRKHGADPFLADNQGRTARAALNHQIFVKHDIIDALFRYEFEYACEKELESVVSKLLEENNRLCKQFLESGLNIASAEGKLRIIELLIKEGAREFSYNIQLAVAGGHRKCASYLMLCSHCINLDSNAVHNFTLHGCITERGIDVPTSSQDLTFDPEFNLHVPIMLIREGQTSMHGTNEDSNLCMMYLLLTQYNPSSDLVDWSKLGLTYVQYNWLSQLQPYYIRELDMSNNVIGPILPTSLCDLVTLETFNCSGNTLKELPKCLFEMPKLAYLNASCNAIERLFLPVTLSQSIKNLNLSNNQLPDIPDELGNSALSTLKLSNNLLPTFPPCICRMNNLMHLEIDNCKFTDIPNELGQLEDLQHLEIPRISRLDSVSQELPQTKRVLAYLKEKLYSLKPLYQMKMVVVGRAARGKTTLIKRLQKDYVTHKNISTVGIEISDIELHRGSAARKNTSASDRRQTLLNLNLISNQVSYTFHTWDFGGQQEYYATHQCFITPCTLYLLIFSLQHGNIEELRVWLGNISARASGSTVIIVGTHLDKVSEQESLRLRTEIIDKLKIWGFDTQLNVPEIVAVSCEAEYKRTIVELATVIVREAEKMKYRKEFVLSKKVPSSYLELIKTLNELKETYRREHKVPPVLKEEQMWELIRSKPCCEDIDNEYQFNTVTDMLHNLGIILHFKEPSLQNQYFLDPCWLCGMMGQIVTIREKNPFIKDGILEQNKVRHILKEKRFPDSMFPQYLRILNRFEIALKIDSEKILIPSLLPVLDLDKEVFSVPTDIEYFVRKISFKNIPSGFLSRISVSTLTYILSVSDELCNPDCNRSSNLRSNYHTIEQHRIEDPNNTTIGTRKRSNALYSTKTRPRSLKLDSSESTAVPTPLTDCTEVGYTGSDLSRQTSSDSANHMRVNLENAITQEDEAGSTLLTLLNSETGPCNEGDGIKDDLGMDDIFLCEDVDELNKTEELILEENNTCYEVLDSKYLKCWQQGLSFTHPDLVILMVPYRHGERDGIMLKVSRGYMGRRALCYIIDNMSMLIDDWYPGLNSGFNSDQNVRQIIPCPGCTEHEFSYEECLDVITESDTIPCRKNPDTLIQLKYLIPDICLLDLDEESLRNYKEIEFKESADSRVGGGTFGSVYKGQFRGEPVAIKKFFSVPFKPESPFLELRREVNVLKKVSNPCIVKMIAVCLRPNQCLVIEYAPHKDLDVHLHSQGPLPRLFIYKVLHQTACALAYLHKKHIIYRDLKPSNILVFSLDIVKTPNVKLSDYGIAGVGGNAGIKGLQGTTGFQAPEMLVYKGMEEYTDAVDVYSFAFLLYECICRKKAYSDMHRFDINKRVVSNIRPDGYKSIRMSRFGMRNLKKLMEECWVSDHTKRTKMKTIGKMLCHPGYQMLMGLTMPPNALGATATCSVFSENSQTVWIGCRDENNECKVMLMRGNTLDVTMLRDIERNCQTIIDMAVYKDKMLLLGWSQYSRRLYQYSDTFDEDPEFDLTIESGIGQSFKGHCHLPECIVSTQNEYLFVGYCCGKIFRKSFDDLRETSNKGFVLPCKTKVRKILEYHKEKKKLRNEDDVASEGENTDELGHEDSEVVSISRALSFKKRVPEEETNLIALTEKSIYILNSDFKHVKRFPFAYGVGENVLVVTSGDRLFAAIKGATVIYVFNLKKGRQSKHSIDLLDSEIQRTLDNNIIIVLSMHVTQDLLWVGTSIGSVLFFGTSKPHKFITYIRPCVADILTILPYTPQHNLQGVAASTPTSGSHASTPSNTTPDMRYSSNSSDRSSTPRSVHRSMSDNVLIPPYSRQQRILENKNKHDKYNSDYRAGTMVCICGIGRLANISNSLNYTAQTAEDDQPHGLHSIVLEALPKQHLQYSHNLYQNGGLL